MSLSVRFCRLGSSSHRRLSRDCLTMQYDSAEFLNVANYTHTHTHNMRTCNILKTCIFSVRSCTFTSVSARVLTYFNRPILISVQERAQVTCLHFVLLMVQSRTRILCFVDELRCCVTSSSAEMNIRSNLRCSLGRDIVGISSHAIWSRQPD